MPSKILVVFFEELFFDSSILDAFTYVKDEKHGKSIVNV